MIPTKEVERVCSYTGYSYIDLIKVGHDGYKPTSRWLVMRYFWNQGYTQEEASSIFNQKHCIVIHALKELKNIESLKGPIGKYELIRRFENKVKRQLIPVDNEFYPFVYNANIQQQ